MRAKRAFNTSYILTRPLRIQRATPTGFGAPCATGGLIKQLNENSRANIFSSNKLTEEFHPVILPQKKPAPAKPEQVNCCNLK